jgi:hypothetical protein
VQEEEGQEGLQEEAEAEQLMGRVTLAGGLAFAVSAVALLAAPVAGATTYNNDTPITIAPLGAASPYPSSITVSGTAPPLTDLNVGLDGVTHGAPFDIKIVLVGPTGQALSLLNCVGGNTPPPGAFITLDDAAATAIPNAGPLTTGTFKPTSYCGANTGFPPPGPATYNNPGPGAGGTATFQSTFNGTSPIGTWNLYVIDSEPGGGGTIPGGWSLDVNPDVTPPPVVTPTPTLAPTTPPTPAKKKCKKKGKKAVASAKKCKKKKKKPARRYGRER